MGGDKRRVFEDSSREFSRVFPHLTPPLRNGTLCGMLECHTVLKPKMTEFDTPTLIMHSPDDKVTDHCISKMLYENMKNKDH